MLLYLILSLTVVRVGGGWCPLEEYIQKLGFGKKVEMSTFSKITDTGLEPVN